MSELHDWWDVDLKAAVGEEERVEDLFTTPHSFSIYKASPSSLHIIAEEPEDEEDEEGFEGEGGRFHSTHLRLFWRFWDR